MNHGTISAFYHGCRCEPCKQAKSDQARRAGRTHTPAYDRKAIREALLELCPTGLTDQCPARRGQR